MNHLTHNAMVNFIWGIVDGVLRDVYICGKIAPADTVIRRQCAGDSRQVQIPQPDPHPNRGENMQYGSILSSDAFLSREFDFMLSKPFCGKSWKTDQERLGGKGDTKGPRFIVEHNRLLRPSSVDY